jgi:hypothetical protein
MSSMAMKANAAEWVGAVGAVGAIATALFLQLWIPFWRRPKLRIPSGAKPDPVSDADNDGVQGEWWDIAVENRGRRDTALAAQVMLTAADSRAPSPPLKLRVPLRSLKWTHLQNAQADVPAGVRRGVELGKVKPKGNGLLLLGIFPPLRHSKRGELAEGSYRLEFAVVARNARARYYRLDLDVRSGTLHFPNGIIEQRRQQAARASIGS